MMRPERPTRARAVAVTVLLAVFAVVAYHATMPVLLVGIVTSTIASWWFLLTYLTTTRWEQHLTGWNMALLSVSLTGLLTLALVAPFAPGPAYYLGTFLYAGLTVSSLWMVRTLRRVQAEHRTAPDAESTASFIAHPRNTDQQGN